MQKNEQKFIYLFSEANKNRLLGNSQKAVEFYMSALDLKPNSAASNYYLAELFMANKNYNSALNFAEKAIKLVPDNLWYSLIKGDILYIQKKDNEAYFVYKNLQQKYTDNELIYDRIIELLLEKIKKSKNNENHLLKNKDVFNKFIYIYNEKQKHFGYDLKIAEYLYNIYIEIQNRKKAFSTLQEMVKYEPNELKYKALIAENYVNMHEDEKAEKLYTQLKNKFPDNVDIKLSYLKFCKYKGKFNEYLKTTKELLKTNLEFNKKVNLIISGRYPNFPPKEYKEVLTILYNKHPKEIVSNTLFAEYYIEKDINKALPYLIKAANKSNGDFNIILTLFEVSYDSKNYEILFQQSLKYMQMYPNQAKVFLYNGIGAYKTKRYNEAIKVLKMGKDFVIEDNNLLLQFHFYLAETYHSQKDNKKSDENFDKVLDLNPKFYLALNNYSYYLSERKIKLQKALSMAETCIKYQNENPVFCDTYAKALFENKYYKKALIYSEKAIKIISNNPDFLENYGDILFANNMKDKALINWTLSKANGNKSKKLNFKIDKKSLITNEEEFIKYLNEKEDK